MTASGATIFHKALLRLRGEVPSNLEIGGRSVPLLVRENASARRIVLRISPCGGILKLTVPRRTSARTILAFLDRHRGWADERLSRRTDRIVVCDRALVPFRGSDLAIEADPSRRASLLRPASEDRPATLLVGGEPMHLPRRVKDFFVREARRDLESAVERHARAAKVRPAGLSLKDTTSRWGSCSTTRRLSFSWRIVMAPPAVLDYLAAHEVAHLREMNHGPDFWALCRELCPQMDEPRAWLKRHGTTLHGIDFG